MAATLTTGTGIKLIKQASFQDTEPTVTGGEDIPFLDESISGEFDALEVRHSQDRSNFEAVDGNLGREEVSGDFTTFVDNDSVGFLLYALFGDVTQSVDDPAVGADTHTFSMSDTIPYNQIAAQYGTHDDVKHAYNMLFDSASFDFTDEMLQATWSVTGADINDKNADGPLTYTFPGQNWFHFRQATAKINPASGTETEVSIRSATMDIENNVIADDFVLGDANLDSVLPGEFGGSGTIEVRFDPANQSAFESWFQGDESATVILEYERATNEVLRFRYKNVYVNSQEIAMATQEMIDRSIDFEAYDDGNGDHVEVEIVTTDQTQDFSTY